MKKIDGRTKKGEALKAAMTAATANGVPDSSIPVGVTVHPREKTVLEEAHDMIYGDREGDYGPPSKNLGDIANFWEMYLHGKYGAEFPIGKEDVCHMMVLLKMARSFNGPEKRDTFVDMAGYVGLIERVK